MRDENRSETLKLTLGEERRGGEGEGGEGEGEGERDGEGEGEGEGEEGERANGREITCRRQLFQIRASIIINNFGKNV
jgi:hypothetical protein